MQMNKSFMAVMKLLLMVCVFAWLFQYANANFIDVITGFSQVSPALLALPLFFFLLHTVITYSAWHKSLLLFGVQESSKKTAPLFAFSTLTKYIPGGIWHAGSRVFVLGTYGHSKLRVLFSILLEMLLSVSVSVMMICFLFPFIGFYQGGIEKTMALDMFLVVVGLLVSVCIVSPFFYKLVFSRYTSKESDGVKKIEFRVRQLATLVFLHALGLLIYALAYYFTFKAYLPEQSLFSVDFLLVVMAATVAGFLVIFSPAGLGVRESVLYLAFSLIIDDPMLLTICLAPRLLLLLSEVLFFLLVKVFGHSYHHNKVSI